MQTEDKLNPYQLFHQIYPKHLMRIYKDSETPTDRWMHLHHTILDACLDVHSIATKQGDEDEAEFLEKILCLLEKRLEMWHPSNYEFDEAVKNLVSVAIKEGRKFQEKSK